MDFHLFFVKWDALDAMAGLWTSSDGHRPRAQAVGEQQKAARIQGDLAPVLRWRLFPMKNDEKLGLKHQE